MRLLTKRPYEERDLEVRRTIHELVESGVPAVAAETTGHSAPLWSTSLYLIIFFAAIAIVLGLRPEISTSRRSTDATTAEQGAATTSVTAQNIAFDTKQLALDANESVTIHFTNADSSAISHNIAIYEDESAAKAVFQGKIIPGGTEIDYTFDTPKSGRYFFRCDVHPEMNGTVVVKPG